MAGPDGHRHDEDRPEPSRPSALVDVTDPVHAVVVAMNLPAELSARALGITLGAAVDPLLVADAETLAESAGNFDRLMRGEIEAYDTFSQFTDVAGVPVTLHLTVRIGSGPDPERSYLAISWHEAGMPAVVDVDPDEEVLDVAQLITTGVLADAPLGVALIDAAHNRYITVNHAYAAILGLPRRELIDRGTEVGRPDDVPVAENAGDVLAVVRGSLNSLTLTLPVQDETDVVRTATLHAIGERERHARYLILCLLERPRTAADAGTAIPRPLLSSSMGDDVFARAVVDADWRLRFIEPPLSALGVEREQAADLSVLPSVHPADLPSLLAAADLVTSGRSTRAVTRVHYRVTAPELAYLSTECEITREPDIPEGWLVLTNRLIGSGGKEIPIADRLRAITLAALNEEDGGFRSSRDATDIATSIAGDHDLTPRETEILGLLIDGARVTTIARNLHLSDGTVRNYLSAIFHKVGVRNQAELVEFATARRTSDR